MYIIYPGETSTRLAYPSLLATTISASRLISKSLCLDANLMLVLGELIGMR